MFHRFLKNDIYRLQRALRIPDELHLHNQIKETGINGLCILLRRLAYPNRWTDLCVTFGRCPSDLCIIFYAMLDHVYNHFSYLVTDLSRPFWLSARHLEHYSATVHRKGAPLRNIWGFIDGTVRPCCRPGMYQEILFSGHKRVHCIKFQSIMCPNGLHAHLFGPIEGRRHDARMLAESQILQAMNNWPMNAQGEPFAVYGDQGYPIRAQLISPFRGAGLTPEQQWFNSTMSKFRQCVEWGFNEIVKNFAFVDFTKNQKILLQPIGKFYIVCTILSNCKCCLYGNQISAYYEIVPPSLENYLNNQ